MSIEVKELRKSFGDPPQEIIKGLSFSIATSEFIAITGRSGSGKSTLLYLLSSLDQATSGEIWIDGERLDRMDDHSIHRFRNEKMGFVFQSHYLLPELTALENVLMPARRTGAHDSIRGRAIELMGMFGLHDKQGSLPGKMSGGEQQRVALARALVMQPKYLFADEPTGNLDSANGDVVLKILRDASKLLGATVVFVTHDPDYAALADRRIHLVDGQILDQKITG